MVFDKEWFTKHQRKLLWFANTWIGRWILRIHGKRSSVGKNKIAKIEPNSITWVNKRSRRKVYCSTEFRTHDKFAKRLYHAFKPIWWIMHFFDWIILDRTVKQFSFGFDTLTVYPDAGTGATTVDGYIVYSGGVNWAESLAATDGTSVQPTIASGQCIRADITSFVLARGFYLFLTSALTASSTVSAAVFSLASEGTAVQDADSTDVDIVSSSPASNNDLVLGDYDQIGTTVFASKALSAWTAVDNTYNDFTLDANGISNISKIGVSKFATRSAIDTDGGTPTGANQARAYYADNGATTSDPKLVVTYTLPAVASAGVMVGFSF